MDGLTAERVGWLRSMLARFRELQADAFDPDPTATEECVREVEGLLMALERGLTADPQDRR